MVSYENQCVDCGRPCMGNSCPYRNVKVLTCDICKSEVDRLYKFYGDEICEDCLLDSCEVIE